MSSSDLIHYFMIMGISMYREFVNRYPITTKPTSFLNYRAVLPRRMLPRTGYMCARTTIDVIGIRRVDDANRIAL